VTNEESIDVRALGTTLLAALREEMPHWSATVVAERGGDPVLGHSAGMRAYEALEPELRALLNADIDAQRGTPLSILRRAVEWPTEVLRAAGIETVVRDSDDETRFPADVYGLTPAAFSDFGEASGDAGLRWSVGKAFEHKRRHQQTPSP
jgi:hypothetical protein